MFRDKGMGSCRDEETRVSCMGCEHVVVYSSYYFMSSHTHISGRQQFGALKADF